MTARIAFKAACLASKLLALISPQKEELDNVTSIPFVSLRKNKVRMWGLAVT